MTRDARTAFAYPALLLLGALDAAAYSIIAPVAPEIARQTGAGPALIGLLAASFPAGIAVGFIVAGAAIGRGRYAEILLGSLGLLGFGALAFASTDSLPGYVAARIVMGLGSGGLWMGVTFSTLDRWPGQEYLCMSRIFAAYSVGGLLGPGLGAIEGIAGPFLAYAGLVVVAVAVVLVVGRWAPERTARADRRTLVTPAFRAAAAGILFAVLALGIVEGVLPLHLASRLDQRSIALVYVGMSIVVALAAALAARFGPRTVLLASTGLVVVGLGGVGIGADLRIWLVGLAVAGVGIGMANTGSIGVLLAGVDTGRSITAIVVWSQLGILGYLLGPAVGGAAAEIAGFGVVGAIVALGALPVVLLGRRPAGTARAG